VAVLDAVVLSDLHLGAQSCQVHTLQNFLENLPPTRQLILNGDVLENTESRLTKQHWRVLSRLRKYSDQLELIWVRGNHDSDAESIAHLIGATFVPEFAFTSGGRRVLCVHGDAWDQFLTDHPWLTIAADWFYLNMQRLSRRLAIRAKRQSKTVLHCVEKVRREALDYAKAKRADVVICGHTHNAEAPSGVLPTSPAYFNTGSWTDHDCHYLTADNGLIKLDGIKMDPVPDADFNDVAEPAGIKG
jgi:UDP-2,3-diacylglucosamine pyrophosphatase LpxH